MDLKELKEEHYKTAKLNIDRIERREVSFQCKPWAKASVYWKRAQYFQSVEKLREALIENAEDYIGIFASVSKYQDPQIPAPSKRGLMSSDLIIDVDMKAEGSRLDWMHEVCSATASVLSVLKNTFGISEDDMTLEFSGNKGFHITITDQRYTTMSRDHRSAIIEYIRGDNLSRDVVSYYGGGWGESFKSHLRSIAKISDKKDRLKILSAMGLPSTTCKKVSALLKDPTVSQVLSEGRYDYIDDKIASSLRNTHYKAAVEEFSVVDAKVGKNIYAILRIPGTIHASSGLVSTLLEFEDLNDPDVIFDKIKEAGGLDPVEITLTKPAVEDLDRVHEWPVGTHTVPRWLALHLLH